MKLLNHQCLCYCCNDHCRNNLCVNILLWIKRNSLSIWVLNKFGIRIFHFSYWSCGNNFNLLSFECQFINLLYCVWWKYSQWRLCNCTLKHSKAALGATQTWRWDQIRRSYCQCFRSIHGVFLWFFDYWMHCWNTHFFVVQVLRISFNSLDRNRTVYTCKLLPICSLWENWLLRNFSNFDWSNRFMKLCMVLSQSVGISHNRIWNRYGWKHIRKLYLCICWN